MLQIRALKNTNDRIDKIGTLTPYLVLMRSNTGFLNWESNSDKGNSEATVKAFRQVLPTNNFAPSTVADTRNYLKLHTGLLALELWCC